MNRRMRTRMSGGVREGAVSRRSLLDLDIFSNCLYMNGRMLSPGML